MIFASLARDVCQACQIPRCETDFAVQLLSRSQSTWSSTKTDDHLELVLCVCASDIPVEESELLHAWQSEFPATRSAIVQSPTNMVQPQNSTLANIASDAGGADELARCATLSLSVCRRLSRPRLRRHKWHAPPSEIYSSSVCLNNQQKCRSTKTSTPILAGGAGLQKKNDTTRATTRLYDFRSPLQTFILLMFIMILDRNESTTMRLETSR